MEEEITWKGHTFTLLVFTGIVVLCSIFFILGMLMGRTQAQKVALAAPAETVKTDAKTEGKEDNPDFTFYDSVKKEKTPVLEPPPAPAAEPEQASSQKTQAQPEREVVLLDPPPVVTSKPENSFNYQIGALRKAEDAEKLVAAVKKKGFRAFILAPVSGDPNPFFRVQVGPFSDQIDAERTKKKLEGEGYQPILKK